uniref:DUF2029 domain-containing protein n=1 Tax=Ignavibacterium album TaxID=591197 RepID=A0A7V3E6Z2_9BACT
MTLIIFAGIIFRIILIPTTPIASDDVYRYLWDGKVQANGINPYTYAPNDEALKHLHSELLPEKVNFPHLKTIYPPYSQWIFLLAYLIAGESVLGIKILLLISEIFTILLIYLTLKNFRLNEKYVLVYALSPLPILQFFIDAHVDGFGITLFALFFYFLSQNKLLYSYFALGLSITSKLITLMVYPFLLKGRSIKNFLALIIVPTVTVTLVYLPYSINGFPFESLFIFAQKWYSNGAVFTLFQKIFNDNYLSRIFSMSLFFLSFIWLYFSKKDFIDKAYLIFILFFIFSPVVHPWYLTWLAFLTAINFRWSGIAFISTISIANIYALNYILNKKWEMNDWFLLLEYLPVVILLLWEEFNFVKNKRINHELS